MTRITWIGLGIMGIRMAPHLVAAGHTVIGLDINPEARARAEELGLITSTDQADAIAQSDLIITMLPSGEHVRAVFSGPAGILEHAAPGTLVLDSSTVDLDTSRWCHEAAAEAQIDFVDAPVSRGVTGAEQGNLSFMLGGAPDAADRAREAVAPMSGDTIVAGGPTMGIAAKLVNNLMLFINQLASAEGSQLAEHLGLDPRVLWDIVSASSGRSWVQQHWYPVPGIAESAAVNRDFAAGYSVDLAAKDARLALDAGAETGVRLPATALAATQFVALQDAGLGAKDCSLVALFPTPKQRLGRFSL